jgi:hypothetical protein
MNHDLFNPELSLLDLTKEERKLKMQIKGYNYAIKNADFLKLENTPVGSLEKKEAELLAVREKLTIIYN